MDEESLKNAGVTPMNELKQDKEPSKVEEGQDESPKPSENPDADLITRVSQFASENKPSEKQEDSAFNVNEIEKIEDPVAKEYALKAYKSFQADYTRKTQKLSEQQKQLEEKMKESSNWTPERIQSLLNDPTFVQAAQQITGTQNPEEMNEDEYSALSDSDKKKIDAVHREIQAMKNQNAQLVQKQQEEKLKSKYANYDPQAMDITTKEVLQGKRQITREDIWKSMDYEKAIDRAYQMGLKDKNEQTQEKIQSSSAEGLSTLPQEKVDDDKKSSDRDHFAKIVLNKITQKNKKTEVR